MSRNRLIIILVAGALVILFLTYGLIDTWNLILLRPILNFLILLSNVFFGNFGLAIIALVIIVRLVMTPLTLKQLHSTRAMHTLQPKMKELQKKYAKDKDKLKQEIAKLYKESGVSPMGCLGPMLLQLPIWIALYRSILHVAAATPEALLGLSNDLYSWSAIHQAVPLDPNFLWLNLTQPDVPPTGYFILPILVAASMYVLQKMSTVPSTDPQQQSMSKMMIWMMPLMFGFFTLMFPSGLALFWVVSTIVGIVTQYFITGWGSLFVRAPAPAPQVAEEQRMETPEGALLEDQLATERVEQQERVAHGKSRDKRKDRRRSRRAGARKTRRKP
ncbi:MAG: membrane protein insertase YidC [Dehalococcoidia bacterium]|nr:MAG: membrane protein insertase YidC [Dehalococcoidia bacterium]